MVKVLTTTLCMRESLDHFTLDLHLDIPSQIFINLILDDKSAKVVTLSWMSF
jgi:hypothetical protein